jgi:hypothetical protein
MLHLFNRRSKSRRHYDTRRQRYVEGRRIAGQMHSNGMGNVVLPGADHSHERAEASEEKLLEL